MKISKSLVKVAIGMVAGLTVPGVLLGAGVAANAAGDAPSANSTEAPVANLPFADALAAFNTANAALSAAVADTSAGSSSRQQAYQVAKAAYNQLISSALDARQAADKAFRDAVKLANDAYKAARAVKGQTPDQRLAAQNKFAQALNYAASVRDSAYKTLIVPEPPLPPTKQGKADKSGKPKNS